MGLDKMLNRAAAGLSGKGQETKTLAQKYGVYFDGKFFQASCPGIISPCGETPAIDISWFNITGDKKDRANQLNFALKIIDTYFNHFATMTDFSSFISEYNGLNIHGRVMLTRILDSQSALSNEIKTNIWSAIAKNPLCGLDPHSIPYEKGGVTCEQIFNHYAPTIKAISDNLVELAKQLEDLRLQEELKKQQEELLKQQEEAAKQAEEATNALQQKKNSIEVLVKNAEVLEEAQMLFDLRNAPELQEEYCAQISPELQENAKKLSEYIEKQFELAKEFSPKNQQKFLIKLSKTSNDVEHIIKEALKEESQSSGSDLPVGTPPPPYSFENFYPSTDTDVHPDNEVNFLGDEYTK